MAILIYPKYQNKDEVMPFLRKFFYLGPELSFLLKGQLQARSKLEYAITLESL